MEKRLEELELRIQDLEDFASNSAHEVEDLEFVIRQTENNLLNQLRIQANGNHRKWRETRDLRGAVKYSNWSVNVTVINENNTPVKCDWIKLSNCNYRIKQNPIVVERANIGITTDDKKGWDDISFDVEIKCMGVTYNKVRMTL